EWAAVARIQYIAVCEQSSAHLLRLPNFLLSKVFFSEEIYIAKLGMQQPTQSSIRRCQQKSFRLYRRNRALIHCLMFVILVTLTLAAVTQPGWNGDKEVDNLSNAVADMAPVDQVRVPAGGPNKFVNEAPWAVKRSQDQGKLIIPKLIHHYFGEVAGIPARLVSEIHSWAVNHPDYEIHYWDAASVETKLLSKVEYAKYKRYYWNGTASSRERSLIARLLILHSLGGLSPDLNMRSLQSSTSYLTDSNCVIAQDRVEKAVFQFDFESLPSLSFLACKPKHHFVEYFLRKITEVSLRTGAVVLDVDTPAFLLHSFNSAVAAYDDECSARADCDFQDRVSLAEPAIFMPVMEPHLFDSLVDNCRHRDKLPFLKKEACYNLDANGNKPAGMSLAMPVYLPVWAPNKDRPLLSLARIAPAAGLTRKVKKHWRFQQS
ncbi:hypothetical protein BOX15_Mlig023016g2, partial [Macrostomum lignano]